MNPKPEKDKRVQPSHLSLKRILTFRLICIGLPLLALGLLEGSLRLFGLGGYAPIIRTVGKTQHGTLLITDPAGPTTWFFANRKHPGSCEQYSFYQPKSANTVRIVLVGESAMKGFPEPRHLAGSVFLREMLKDVWPSRPIEVINLGTTAVASYPVLGIMTEALKYEPDLVIASTGHNEFFGTYGVASVGWAGGKPWMLGLTRFVHSLALVQGLEKVVPSREPNENKTLMEMMIGRSYVGPDDWRRKAAANNLEHNVAAMVDRCGSRGVPIIVCTQASNERDLAPVGEDHFNLQDDAKRFEFNRLFDAGTNALSQNPAVALEQFQAALLIASNSANAQFYAGKALFALGRNSEASLRFQRARDLDTMPWRTPSLSQEAIVHAAIDHGALICDLEKTFRTASPGGAIGWELMDDHVHPTLDGQALFARAIVESMTHFSGRLQVSREAYDRLASAKDYERRLGANPFDAYSVSHTMRVVFGVPFMRESNPQAYIRFNAMANEIEGNYPFEIRTVMRDWQTALPHAGGKRPITGMVSRVLMREGKFAEALDLLRIAQTDVPDYTSWHMEYVYFALACQEKLHGTLSNEQKAEALEEIKQGQFLLQHGFSESGLAERYLGRLHQLRGEFAEAVPYLLHSRKKLSGNDLVAADEALVVSYIKTGRPDEARRVVTNGIAHAGRYAHFYQEMLPALTSSTRTNRNPSDHPPEN